MLPKSQINYLYEALGKRIRELRETEDYTQTHFAELLKISRASLVNIEQGRQRPPLHALYEIARLLETTLTDLLPNLQEGTQPSSSLEEKIMEKSMGDPVMRERLLEFVSTTNKSK